MKTLTLTLAAFATLSAILHVADAFPSYHHCESVFPAKTEGFYCGKTINKGGADPKSLFYCYYHLGSSYVEQFPDCVTKCVTSSEPDPNIPGDTLYKSYCEGAKTQAPKASTGSYIGTLCGTIVKALNLDPLASVSSSHLYGLTYQYIVDLGECSKGCDSKTISGNTGKDKCKT
ncbi:hypothetical protein BC937DRAFT_89806 [Endogone sp. FLAS-F59071]|nr:hypothetical protein BC937DRAFT_89806 [Endogone sp. FLAS-F59071]|eukprot:RUS17566.1 hypothetical protein BC937DRAFT_89806 [Endogone sp. FLAS-F59071]